MKLFVFPIGVIIAASAARPAGYVDAVLAAGTVSGEGDSRVVTLTEDAYAALLKRYSGKTIAEATAASRGLPQKAGGPGTELKAILKDWLGIEATAGCGCNQTAARMDALGPDWCESDAGMTEILGTMRREHAKRWKDGRTKLPWTDIGARQLVKLACRRARKSSVDKA